MPDTLFDVLENIEDEENQVELAYRTGISYLELKKALGELAPDAAGVSIPQIGPGEQTDAPLVLDHLDMTSMQSDIQTALKEQKVGFISHLIPYSVVIPMLAAMNIFVTGTDFYWFLFAMWGWGIGLAAHGASWFYKSKYYKKLSRYKKIKLKLLLKVRDLFKEKEGFAAHLASYLTAIPGLAAINLTLSPEFWWFLMAAGGWGVGVASHYVAYRFKKQDLLADIRQLEPVTNDHVLDEITTPPELPEGKSIQHPVIEEAIALSSELQAAIEVNTTFEDEWKTEMNTLIDDYLGNLGNLTQRMDHVEKVLGRYPERDLIDERRTMTEKRDTASDSDLVREYEETLEKIEHQVNSVRSLSTQRDKLELKINNGLRDLKQMQLDLTRLETLSPDQQDDHLDSIRQKSQELTLFANIFDKELSNL